MPVLKQIFPHRSLLRGSIIPTSSTEQRNVRNRLILLPYAYPLAPPPLRISEGIKRNIIKFPSAFSFMLVQPYSPSVDSINQELSGQDSAIDSLMHSKSRLLRSKLEVLASEIYTRLAMWERNLARIDRDKVQVESLVSQFTRLARYHLREPKDITRFHESNLRLEAQRRTEDVECWRDLVMVMRDFLETWEAHEQAKNRSIFINDVGAGN